jgi:hypothetical protein
MNSEESRVLKDAIRAVRCHNRHAWWQLKREIFEHGFQSYYPAQTMFERPAQVVAEALNPLQITQLRRTWSSAQPVPADSSQLVRHYAGVIVAEVVRRARVAAYRTENW